MENLLLRTLAFLLVAAIAAQLHAAPRAGLADRILVDKSEHSRTVFSKARVIATFRAGFGVYPDGPKERRGDRKTPEGAYILDYKNQNSAFYRSIHISYPNQEDRERARRGGYDPGGDIMVHGQ